ncbi:hypothetical protein AB1Y20_021083 [Prymnesium parvum]|uniref:RING-type domain-containing protein n=1 Tax=Prymnesium parvum TaxID=97485 RepID=A0AB34JIN0_PRYPA
MALTFRRSLTRRGEGPAAFLRPTYCIFVAGNVLMADELQNCVHIVPVDPSAAPPQPDRIDGAVGRSEKETASLRFCYPTGLASDGVHLFVADSLNYRIQKLRLSDRASSACAGSRGGGANQLKGPQGMALAAGLLLVADFWSHRVLVYDAELRFLHAFGSEGNEGGQLCKPTGIAVHAAEVFVADSGNGRVQVYTLGGAFRRAIGARFEPPSARRRSREREGEFANPRGVAIAALPSGALLLVAEFGGKRVHLLRLDGALLQTCVPPAGGGLCGVCLSPDGAAVYVADGTSPQLHEFGLSDAAPPPPPPPPAAAAEEAEEAEGGLPLRDLRAELERTRVLLARARGEEHALRALGLEEVLALELQLGEALRSVQSRRVELVAAEEAALQRRRECVCCFDRPRAVAFSPCGHKVCCGVCAANVEACPTCRVPIELRLTIYE